MSQETSFKKEREEKVEGESVESSDASKKSFEESFFTFMIYFFLIGLPIASVIVLVTAVKSM